MKAKRAVLGGGGAILLALLAWAAGHWLPQGLHRPSPAGGWADWLLLAALGLALLLLAVALLAMDRQQRRLERLRGALLISAGLGTALPRPSAQAPDEIDRLQQAIASLIGRERDRRGLLDRRLEAVLGAIDDAIIVVTAQGQASLINAAGKVLLGSAAGLGSSLFDVFDRESLAFAMTL